MHRWISFWALKYDIIEQQTLMIHGYHLKRIKN